MQDSFTVPLPLAAKEITDRSGEPCSWTHAWQAVITGSLRAQKVRGRWMCSRQSLDAFIAIRTESATAGVGAI